MAKITHNIVVMDETHHNMYHATFKRSLKNQFKWLPGKYYWPMANALSDAILNDSDSQGYVAVAAEYPTEYLGWLMRGRDNLIYVYTASDFRGAGICASLMRHADLTWDTLTVFRSKIWDKITKKFDAEFYAVPNKKRSEQSTPLKKG